MNTSRRCPLTILLLLGCDAEPPPPRLPPLQPQLAPLDPNFDPFGSPEPAPAPAPTTNVAPATTMLVPFVPVQLGGLTREHLTPLPELGIVAAKYRDATSELDLNIARITDSAAAKGMYAGSYPEKAASRGVRVHLRSYTLDTGPTREACALLRDVISVCVAVSGGTREALAYLDEVDLPGLVDLAASEGAPNGLGELTFATDEAGWSAIEAGLRESQWAPMIAGCKAEPGGQACKDLQVQRKDCRAGNFDSGLVELDVELTATEKANFYRLWQINCALAGVPVGEQRR